MALQYGLGYRQTPVGAGGGGPSPGQQMTPPIQPQTQQPSGGQSAPAPGQAPQVMPANTGGYEALVQALAAQQAQQQAGRHRAAQGRKYPGWGSVANSGLQGYLAERAEDRAAEASQEALRLKDDQKVLEEAEKRKVAFKAIEVFNPGMKPEEILPLAKAVANGQLKLEDMIPKAQSQGAAMQEFQTLAAIYGEDEAKKKFATKYKEDGDGEDKGKDVGSMSGEQRRTLGMLVDAKKNLDIATDVLVKDGEFTDTAFLPFTEAKKVMQVNLRKAYKTLLRIKSGATLNESELEEEVNNAMPGVMDSDAKSLDKLNTLKQEIGLLYESLTMGYDQSGLPDDIKGQSNDLEEQARAAIAAGADPAEVAARMREMQGG